MSIPEVPGEAELREPAGERIPASVMNTDLGLPTRRSHPVGVIRERVQAILDLPSAVAVRVIICRKRRDWRGESD